jgi:3-oxoacyl-[acyl-carrier protein] reductase
MNINMEGKTALVCGSSQGIGKAAAIELASLGARVVLMARNETALKSALAELPGTAAHAYLVADFSDYNSVAQAVNSFLQNGNVIHVVVNNTGGPPAGPITQARIEEFTQAFHNHLLCNHTLAQAVIPGMKAAGYGRIITWLRRFEYDTCRSCQLGKNTFCGSCNVWNYGE